MSKVALWSTFFVGIFVVSVYILGISDRNSDMGNKVDLAKNNDASSESDALLASLVSELSKTNRSLNTMKSEVKNISASYIKLAQRVEELSSGMDLPDIEISELDHQDYSRLSNEEFEKSINREKAAYDAEIVDFTWSAKAEGELEQGLEDKQDELNFSIVSARCRTTRCKTIVSFDNYELAEEYGNRLAEIQIPGLNCAQSIFLPVPSDISVRYEAELLLDCSAQVQGLVQSN